MVVIRLNRGGSKKRPKYRITVADSRKWLGGKFLEVIGHYNPFPRGSEQKLDRSGKSQCLDQARRAANRSGETSDENGEGLSPSFPRLFSGARAG